MKYFLIAGEASGDLHASELIKQLRIADPGAQFAFLGGDLMAQAAGCQPLVHYSSMAYMGFAEVLRHAFSIMGIYRKAKRGIADFRPDCLVLVDYPSFNLSMAAYARRLGVPVAYYILPKAWAWKEWRTKQLRSRVDLPLSILPFEVGFFASRGVDARYVGNPTLEEVARCRAQAPALAAFAQRNRLPEKPIIALLPGSRKAEIKANLPLMAEAVSRFPQYRGVVAGAPGIAPEIYAAITKLPVVMGQTSDLLAVSRAAIVTSGTATLEAALMDVPQVAVYRNNGSKLAYDVMKRVLKVRYVTLPNLIADAPVVPELLLHQCTVDSIFEHLAPLLSLTSEARAEQLAGYRRIRSILGPEGAARRAAALIASLASTR